MPVVLGGGDAPDPHVLWSDGEYFLYTTMSGWTTVPVWRSDDHTTWTWAGDALPQLPAWAAWGHTWAPGAVELDGRFALYFTARHVESGRQCIGVAVADRPEGPFVPDDRPLVCDAASGGSIDPYPFADTDGRRYLYWKVDANAVGGRCSLWAAPLASDGRRLAGAPVRLLDQDAAWEHPTVENPAMARDGSGRYLLFYSGGWWESATYGIGYATCAGPLGPCTKATAQGAWFTATGSLVGVGGEAVFVDPAGAHMAAHAWTAPAVTYGSGGSRRLVVAPLSLADRPTWHLFGDVDATGVHAPAIERAAELGLVRGGTDGLFHPDDLVTRAQAATALANLLAAAGSPLPPGPDAFVDDEGSVHEPALDALAAAGVLSGVDGRRADPAGLVTRGQLATMLRGVLERLLGSALPAGPDAFVDDEASLHEPAVDALAAAGLVHGIGGGAFAPLRPVTRAQAATTLTAAVDLALTA